MARKKKYSIGVNFVLTTYVDVVAKDIDEAKDLAEEKASEEFEELLNDGMFGIGDFDYEAFEV